MKKLIVFGFLLCFGQLQAQVDLNKLIHFADSIMLRGEREPMYPGAVLGITTSDSIHFLRGYGYADVRRKSPVSPDQTLFQIGSVGKLFTSISLLQQLDDGGIQLDDDVNIYLEDWQVSNPFDVPVTPFHLLTHSGGFNDKFIGYMARDNQSVQPLGLHLKQEMPSVFIEPGTEINYSNYGYALAGHLVERLSKETFEDQIEKRVLRPLGMNTTSYYLPDDYQSQHAYANGYLSRDTFELTRMYPRHAKPAGSALSTGRDMMIFAKALLSRDSTLLSTNSFDLLLTEQFSNHPTLTGYTAGMEVQNFGGQYAISKAGQTKGFLTVLIVFPEWDVAMFLATNTETDNFLTSFFDNIKSKYFPPIQPALVESASETEIYIGHYTSERCSHSTIEEMFAMFSGHFEVYPTDSGRIKAYHDGSWNEYQEIDDGIFQHLRNREILMVFKKDVKGNLKMYRNVEVGGVSVPASFRKLGWLERPRFVNDEYPFALLFLFSYLLLPFYWLIRYLIRFRTPGFGIALGPDRSYHMVAFGFLGLLTWHFTGFFIPLIRMGEEMAFGISQGIAQMKYVHWGLAITALILAVLTINLWFKKKGYLLYKIYYTLFSIIAFSYILFLCYWHLFNVSV